MGNVIAQIVGLALLVLGGQGGIRLLIHHDDAGLLAWLPGGFVAQLICYFVAIVLGIALAGWGSRRAKASHDE